MPAASPHGFDVCTHAVAAKCVRGARRVAPSGGKWVRAIQSRSCCSRQPCALASRQCGLARWRGKLLRSLPKYSACTTQRAHLFVCRGRCTLTRACVECYACHCLLTTSRCLRWGPKALTTETRWGKQWHVPVDSTDSSAGIV